ncbi:MAG TPA: SgcJ/EcaC family oxidoreductase [Pirellulales bacterium]|jgi:uncharacterized protein (TIGR02246 family)|nr:SgcJ/EcaC family oxidoreductase [Pirellulales bacterium]
MFRFRLVLTTAFLIAIAAPCAVAVDAAASDKEELDAIRAAAKAYVKALEQGNPDSLTSAWTSDGDYVDAAGRSFKARDLIATEFHKGTGGHRRDLQATIDRVRLITPEVAVEDGHIQRAAAPGEPPLRSRYTAVWVKRDSRWLLDSLREAALSQPTVNPRLAELKWLLGDFAGSSLDGMQMIVSGSMSSDGNFLLREFFVTLPDGARRRASQRIGWDPLAGGFKSWTFHSDGGYGEGVWKRQGDVWLVNNNGVSPEGKRSSKTTIYSKINDESMIVASVGAMVEDQAEPDVKLKLVRQSPKE